MYKAPNSCKRKFSLLVFLLMATLILSCNNMSTGGNVFFVATNGTDSGPGSKNDPWRTIQYASEVMTAGDTLYIRGGNYYGKISPQNSGSANNYILYRNYPGDSVVINADEENTSIYIDELSYLHFMGLTLTGAEGEVFSSGGFYAEGKSHHIILENITATENDGNGIFLCGNDGRIKDIQIKDSNISDNKIHGIVLWKDVRNVLIDNNIIQNNGWKNDWGHGIKIIDFENTQGPFNITVSNNDISYSRTQGIQTWNAQKILIKGNHFHHNGATGIQIEDYSKFIVVDSNLCEYNAREYAYETGIWIEASESVLVQNNKINNNGIGLILRRANRVLTRRNLIYDNDGSRKTQSNAAGIIIGETGDAIIVHNTLHNNGHKESWRAAFHSEESVSVSSPSIKFVFSFSFLFFFPVFEFNIVSYEFSKLSLRVYSNSSKISWFPKSTRLKIVVPCFTSSSP